MPEPDRWRAHWPLLVAALAYPLWVAYGSLFPLTGWRDSGLSPLVFLGAGLPRYWTGFDLASNVILYLPLGFLWFQALGLRWPRALAWVLATAAAAALSLAVEILQHWLPSRVPSNLDLLCNALGALCGATLAWRYDAAWSASWGRIWWQLLRPARGAEAGVALTIVWALLQLSPEHLLYCSGLARRGGEPLLPFIEHGRRLEVEAVAVAAHMLVVSLLAAQWVSGGRMQVLGKLLVGALSVILAKALVASQALGFAKAFDWYSTGTHWGLLAGAGLALLAVVLAPRWRLLVALLALAVGSLALLALPASPYAQGVAVDLTVSPARNFVGALNWLGILWPAFAFVYVVWQLRTARGRTSGETR
jgi:VanZ family protein